MIILVVDDDTVELRVLGRVLRKVEGAEILTLSSPREALKWLNENTADLILIDQNMPEILGIDMLSLIRAQPHLAEVPVIMATGDSSADLRVEALQKGCSEFLTKPVIFPELLIRVQNLLKLREGQKALASREEDLRDRIEAATGRLRSQAMELVTRLARAAESRASNTGRHVDRVGRYTDVICRELRLEEVLRNQIVFAAPLHDIGKVEIPDGILAKSGRLTDLEVQILRQHTVIGHRILKDSEHNTIRRAAEIALSHHEKFDGSGYPIGLAGDKIPLSGRIVAVADVFDVLTVDYRYNRPRSIGDARNHLVARRGSDFDPTCVDAFVRGWTEVEEIYRSCRDAENEVIPAEH